MKFLNYDSRFMVFLRNTVDYMSVGILWMICCIPVFTCGAATTAALLTVEIALHKDEGRIWATFWKWFRKEFKDATILWAIWVPIQLIIIANIWMLSESKLPIWFQVLICIATFVALCWTKLWFGYLSKFEDPLKIVLKNTLHISLACVGRILVLIVITAIHIAGAVAFFFLMPPLLVLLPGSYLLCYSAVIRKIFDKYLPKETIEEIPTEK